MVKILVIEDSNLMKVYLRRCLERHGFEVEDWTPTSAMEIADHVAATVPDLIITDYLMPGCNGATVARMAQQARPGIPVIAITSDRNEDVSANLARCKVRRVLHKPLEADALVEAVQAVLEDAAQDRGALPAP